MYSGVSVATLAPSKIFRISSSDNPALDIVAGVSVWVSLGEDSLDGVSRNVAAEVAGFDWLTVDVV